MPNGQNPYPPIKNNSSGREAGSAMLTGVVIVALLLVAVGISWFGYSSINSSVAELEGGHGQTRSGLRDLDLRVTDLESRVDILVEEEDPDGDENDDEDGDDNENDEAPVAGPRGATGPRGPAGSDGEDGCPDGNCVDLQGSSPGTQQTGHINVSGDVRASSFYGNGSNVTGVDASYLSGFNAGYFTNASNISSGTLSNDRLASQVSLLGQSIAKDELANSGALSFTWADGEVANDLTVSASGSVADGALSGNVTLQGNTFNGSSQLVQTTGGGALPVLDGSNLTGVDAATLEGNAASFYQNASNLNAGTLSDSRLSANVALLDASQTFSGSVTFSGAGTALSVTNTASIGTLEVAGNADVAGTVTAGAFELSCPTGYIWVPGSAKFGTLPGFCVMRYEAKNVGGVATSQAADAPWVSISQEAARDQCLAIGAGYHLVSEPEWMTIAENIADQPGNWADGTVGSTVAAGGGLFRGNVGTTDSVSYDGANPESGTGRNTKARHTLSNGAHIWDFSGNVWEWTDAISNIDDHPEDDTPASEWLEYTAIIKYKGYNYLRPPRQDWNADYGVGRLYTDVGDTSGSVRASRRGGNWSNTSNAGVFSLVLNNPPSNTSTSIGFRCARSQGS